MLSKFDKEKNRKAYFEEAIKNKTKIRLIFIGQDPYPDGYDNGIAFCKDDLKDLTNTCFPIICSSIGVNFIPDGNGKQFFIELLNEGVMFMNLSYELFQKGKSRIELIEKYSVENLKIIKQLPNSKIVKLGLNYSTAFKRIYNSKTILVHPSRLASRHKDWDNLWGKSANLYNVINNMA